MRRTLSTTLAVALLLALGALAVLALPNANASLAGAPAVSAAAPEFNPDAPAALQNYNMIAVPLNAASQFTGGGYTFTSQGLGDLVGTSAKQIQRWDSARQAYDTWDPINKDGFVGGVYTQKPFALAVGGAYWILLDSTAPAVLSFVGDVPGAGTIKFTFAGASPICAYNEFSVPLEQSTLTNSDLLAESIGGANAAQILRWNATSQTFDTWDPINNDGFVGGSYTQSPWDTKIGYPYVVCLNVGANGKVWP